MRRFEEVQQRNIEIIERAVGGGNRAPNRGARRGAANVNAAVFRPADIERRFRERRGGEAQRRHFFFGTPRIESFERIETHFRKQNTIKTAIEFDSREEVCWSSLLEQMDNENRKNKKEGDSGDIIIPSEFDVTSSLRLAELSETIRDANEVLSNPNASVEELQQILDVVEIHLSTFGCEYESIEIAQNEIIEKMKKLSDDIRLFDNIDSSLRNSHQLMRL